MLTPAQSLIVYAKQDKNFARELYALVQHLRNKRLHDNREIFPEAVLALMPQDIRQAQARAWWLFTALRDGRIAASSSAESLMASWRSVYPEDNDKRIIIGIVGVAIIGPTLGYIKRRKRMPMVVSHNVFGKANRETANDIAEASHKIITMACALAGNNLAHMEPEIGDCFFGDRGMRFYGAGRATLTGQHTELTAQGILLRRWKMRMGITTLALMPALHMPFTMLRWHPEPLA